MECQHEHKAGCRNTPDETDKKKLWRKIPVEINKPDDWGSKKMSEEPLSYLFLKAMFFKNR